MVKSAWSKTFFVKDADKLFTESKYVQAAIEFEYLVKTGSD